MSLGFQFVPIDIQLEGHPKADRAGPEAMGLWLWGMLHARAHKTGGRISRPSCLGAWRGRRNIMLAKRLVEAGLWVLLDDGDWEIWNFGEKGSGAMTPAERARKYRANRHASRDASRDGALRVTGSPSRHVSISLSSPSGYGSGSSGSLLGSSESAAGVRDPGPALEGVPLLERSHDGFPPPWWDGSCDATAMAIGGEVTNRPALWVQYLASRSRKSWAMNHTDAVGWITSVVQAARAKVRTSPPRQKLGSAVNAPWMNPVNFDFAPEPQEPK